MFTSSSSLIPGSSAGGPESSSRLRTENSPDRFSTSFRPASSQDGFSTSLRPDTALPVSLSSFPPRPPSGQRSLHEFFTAFHGFLPQDGGRGESRPEPSFDWASLTILTVNIQRFVVNKDELFAYISSLPSLPSLICLTETWLDESVVCPSVPGYSLVARRDRDGLGGGVAIFAKDSVVDSCSVLLRSPSAERVWILMHTETGPVLISCWYRRPCHGEINSIVSLGEEWNSFAGQGIGTIITGDMNVHHKHWLRHSSHVSPEGTALKNWCLERGFRECIRAPTRGPHLLDLLLSDVPDLITTKVLTQVADHSATLASVCMPPLSFEYGERRLWQFHNADWRSIQQRLLQQDWSWIDNSTPDIVVSCLTQMLKCFMNLHIPSIEQRVQVSHPWLSDECLLAVRTKRGAAGTAAFPAAVAHCSAVMLKAFQSYANRTRQKLRGLGRGSKKWWKVSHQLLSHVHKPTSSPLKRPDGTWALSARAKADLFARAFSHKWRLPAPVVNEFSDCSSIMISPRRWGSCVLRTRSARAALSSLRQDSGTGPDLLPARVLKQCSSSLAVPVAKLARLILRTGRWPLPWREHWVHPLYKKLAVSCPDNYRGIQLTAQLSKVVERMFLQLFSPQLYRFGAYGARQFAYTPGRGARDAVLYFVLQCISALSSGSRVLLYCSDVSGAFDRVDVPRLLAKLRGFSVPESVLGVLASWLESRTARVIVQGKQSASVRMENMIYQGTVLGPPLWNAFFLIPAWRFAPQVSKKLFTLTT